MADRAGTGPLPPAWARTLLRVALFAYPAVFRRQWGEEMEEAFHDGWAEARARGVVPAALFAARTTLNLIRTGLGERLSPSPDPHDPDGRRSRRASLMDLLRQDLRYAVRALLRRPGFTVVAVVTLAVGVGEIVGVAPLGFDYPEDSQLWRTTTHNWSGGCGRGCDILRTVGRLAEGASLEAAEAEVGALAERLQEAYPESNYERVFNLVPLEEHVVGDVRAGLWVLLGAVGIVLLVACANVANLLLVRAQTRSGEVAVRAALGASGGRLVGQVLVESLVLAFAGGVAGVALAVYAVKGLLALAPADVPRLDQVAVNGTVLLFALGLALAVGCSSAWHRRCTQAGPPRPTGWGPRRPPLG